MLGGSNIDGGNMSRERLMARILLGVRIALLVSMLLTVAFIFYNSSLPKQESADASDKLGEIVEEILPDDTPVEDFVLTNLRKIAHFTEYGLLGIEIALYVLIFERRRWYVSLPISYACPFAVGFLDESIQVLSERGPSITDVWIDIGGYATFASLAYLIGGAALLIIYFIRKRMQASAPKGEES